MTFDPSGLERLRHARGPGRVIAWLGLLAMLGGLGVFGFGILGFWGTIGSGSSPRGFPPSMVYGFGVAIVGAIAYTIGLAIGVPKDADMSLFRYTDNRRIDNRRTTVNQRIKNTKGTVIAPIVIDQRIQIVERLGTAIEKAPVPDDAWDETLERYEDVRDAVEGDADAPTIGQRLEDLTDLLIKAGALTNGASTLGRAIIDLAQTLGPAGRTVLSWLGL
jgi:hypothetical protein